MSGRPAIVEHHALETDARPETPRRLVFDIDDVAQMRQRLRYHHLGTASYIEAESRATLLDRYCDTADRRLHRAGCALRLRSVDGQIEAALEFLDDARAGRRHPTIIERLAPPRPHAPEPSLNTLARRLKGAVGTRVRAVIGQRTLTRSFEVTIVRLTFPIHLDGERVGEITLDDVTTTRERHGNATRFGRLAFVVTPSAHAAVEPLVATLTAHPPLAPVTTPRLATCLSAHGLDSPAPVRSETGISDAMTLGEVALTVIGCQLGRILALEPATRLGESAEALHEMRVAIRRLRAALRLFRPGLSPRATRVNAALRMVAASLGRVRDLDVELEQIRHYVDTHGGADAPALQSLVALIHRRRAAARRHMLRILDSRHYRQAVGLCLAMLRHGPLKSVPGAHEPIASAAPRLIARQYRKFRRLGNRITSDSEPAAYHALRICGKRLRYAVEFHAGIYGKPATDWLRRLTTLQRVLGDHQDADIAAASLGALRHSTARELPPRARAAVGRLVDWYDARARDARRAYPHVYRKATGKRARRLLGALRAGADPGAVHSVRAASS